MTTSQGSARQRTAVAQLGTFHRTQLNARRLHNATRPLDGNRHQPDAKRPSRKVFFIHEYPHARAIAADVRSEPVFKEPLMDASPSRNPILWCHPGSWSRLTSSFRGVPPGLLESNTTGF